MNVGPCISAIVVGFSAAKRRSVGAAIGVAVVGSVITSVYRSEVAPARATLPPEAAEQARRNVGRATNVAEQLVGQTSQQEAGAFLDAVREAFVASVTCRRPLVRRDMRNDSTVPTASSPASARRRAPGTWSSSQRILVAEK